MAIILRYKGKDHMRCYWRIAVVLIVSGCATDPSAVTSFSALAPDAPKLHSLTTAYADVPNELRALDVLNNITVISPAETAAQVKTRNQQVAQIDALHAVLVNYMRSLGALANNGLVQTSTDTKDVTDGLTSLSKAVPTLGLTANMITGVGDICTFLADAATAAYRQEQLTIIIAKSEQPFQQLIEAEAAIVAKGVIPDLGNVENRIKDLAEVTHALQVNDEAEAAKSKAGSTGVDGLNPTLQRSGAADVASLYLLRRAMTSEFSAVELQIKAARDYLTALHEISAAHTVLYRNRGDLLSKKGAKAAIGQLSPLVKEANTALQALKDM
jgi:hypothetical protein